METLIDVPLYWFQRAHDAQTRQKSESPPPTHWKPGQKPWKSKGGDNIRPSDVLAFLENSQEVLGNLQQQQTQSIVNRCVQ